MQPDNERMHDGMRRFATLPESVAFQALSDHIAKIDGVVITGLLTDHITEIWLDFDLNGHRFTINNQFGEYWFFVDEPSCSNAVLEQVAEHCARLLHA